MGAYGVILVVVVIIIIIITIIVGIIRKTDTITKEKNNDNKVAG